MTGESARPPPWTLFLLPPLSLPWLRAGGSDDVTHARTHTPSPALRLSLSLSLLLFWDVSVWNNPCVPLSICARKGARVCVSCFHLETHTHNTVRHVCCVCGCSGAPAAQIRSGRILSIFTRNFSSVVEPPSRFPRVPLRLLWMWNTRLPPVWSG